MKNIMKSVDIIVDLIRLGSSLVFMVISFILCNILAKKYNMSGWYTLLGFFSFAGVAAILLIAKLGNVNQNDYNINRNPNHFNNKDSYGSQNGGNSSYNNTQNYNGQNSYYGGNNNTGNNNGYYNVGTGQNGNNGSVQGRYDVQNVNYTGYNNGYPAGGSDRGNNNNGSYDNVGDNNNQYGGQNSTTGNGYYGSSNGDLTGTGTGVYISNEPVNEGAADTNDRQCPKCGAKLKREASFCIYCGQKL